MLAARVLTFYYFAHFIIVLPLLGMTLAAGVAVASFMPLRGRSLRRLPLPVWGMVIAHFGLAVALFGVAADSAFSQERLVAAKVGETVEDGPWRITLVAVEPVAGPNWTALEATLEAYLANDLDAVPQALGRGFQLSRLGRGQLQVADVVGLVRSGGWPVLFNHWSAQAGVRVRGPNT